MKKSKNLPEKDFGVAEMFKKKTVHQKKKKPILDESHKKENKQMNRDFRKETEKWIREKRAFFG